MIVKSCPTNPYLIPKLYIEGMTSDTYLNLVGEEAFEARSCKPEARCFGKTVYGVVLEEFIDLVEKKAKKSFIVVPPETDVGMLVEKGSYVEPIPVEGIRSSIEVCEGLEVSEGSVLAYVLTGKMEARTIRSHVSGVVVYIYSNPASRIEENVVVIAPKEVVKIVRLRPKRG